MKTLLMALLFAIVMSSVALYAQEAASGAPTYTPVSKFDPKRDASRDIRQAIVESQRSGRRVLLDVGGEWCVWCRRLDSLFAARTDLAEFMHRNFVVVKVNYSPENKNETVLSQYPPVAGYPHLFVLGSDGTVLRSQNTGELEKGKGHDPEKVLAFLKKWAPQHPESTGQKSSTQ